MVPSQKLRLLCASVAVYCLVSLMAVTTTSASTNCSSLLLENVSIPAAIQVPAGQKLQVAYYAVGLQHYSFNGSAWVLYNATADLYYTEKRAGSKRAPVVGQHFFLPHPDAGGGQPSWETFIPCTSLVTAKSLQAVTVDPDSITWNLFEATSESGSPELLGAVTYLQRVESKGGLPPSSTEGAQVGDLHATPYSIIYAFYVKDD